jgi:hypothetical protein
MLEPLPKGRRSEDYKNIGINILTTMRSINPNIIHRIWFRALKILNRSSFSKPCVLELSESPLFAEEIKGPYVLANLSESAAGAGESSESVSSLLSLTFLSAGNNQRAKQKKIITMPIMITKDSISC